MATWDSLQICQKRCVMCREIRITIPGFRQLIHVGYKVASELGEVYTNALESQCGCYRRMRN
ncbi:MAG: hypothetical protein MZV63_20435 [Marinilabiliales bacterium]|nr:hypothetical protein [Marinilabiliales bacterium]